MNIKEIMGLNTGLMQYGPLNKVAHSNFIHGFRWVTFGGGSLSIEGDKKTLHPVRMWIFYHPDGRIRTLEVFRSGEWAPEIEASFFSREFSYDDPNIFDLYTIKNGIEIGDEQDIMPLFVSLQ